MMAVRLPRNVFPLPDDDKEGNQIVQMHGFPSVAQCRGYLRFLSGQQGPPSVELRLGVEALDTSGKQIRLPPGRLFTRKPSRRGQRPSTCARRYPHPANRAHRPRRVRHRIDIRGLYRMDDGEWRRRGVTNRANPMAPWTVSGVSAVRVRWCVRTVSRIRVGAIPLSGDGPRLTHPPHQILDIVAWLAEEVGDLRGSHRALGAFERPEDGLPFPRDRVLRGPSVADGRK